MQPFFLVAMMLIQNGDSLLVSPAWVAANLPNPDLVILHVSMEKEDYDRGHIPGARWLNPHLLIADGAPGVELPSAAHIDSVLAILGVNDQSRVVYYGDTWMAPRVFLALEYVGMGDRTALLDGGLAAWRQDGRATATDSPTWARGTVTGRAHPEILASAEWVSEHLDDRNLVLVDGRSPGEYAGSDHSERLPRSGHIPGGVNLPWEETFTEETAALDGSPSRLKPATALRRLFAAAGVIDGRTLVTYCTVGLRASHMYFVARYLGWHPRIYDGSMSEWSRKTQLPIVSGSAPR